MEFTHFNHQGRARMVDVSEKADTLRIMLSAKGVASGSVWLFPVIYFTHS